MDQARLDAAKCGVKTYRGKPCRNPEHIGGDAKTERYVLSGACADCTREKVRSYQQRTRAVIRALSED